MISIRRVWLLSRSFSPFVLVILLPLLCRHVRISFIFFFTPHSMLYGCWCWKNLDCEMWHRCKRNSDESESFFYIHLDASTLLGSFLFFSFFTFCLLRKCKHISTQILIGLDFFFKLCCLLAHILHGTSTYSFNLFTSIHACSLRFTRILS